MSLLIVITAWDNTPDLPFPCALDITPDLPSLKVNISVLLSTVFTPCTLLLLWLLLHRSLSQTYSLGAYAYSCTLSCTPGPISCIPYCLLAQALLSTSMDPSWLSPSAWASAYIAVGNNPSFSSRLRHNSLLHPWPCLDTHGYIPLVRSSISPFTPNVAEPHFSFPVAGLSPPQ